MNAVIRRTRSRSNSRLHVVTLWRRRQSVGHEVDADIGVARVSPGSRVLGALHVAEQAIFASVGSQRSVLVTGVADDRSKESVPRVYPEGSDRLGDMT